jgi:hypothetical protein
MLGTALALALAAASPAWAQEPSGDYDLPVDITIDPVIYSHEVERSTDVTPSHDIDEDVNVIHVGGEVDSGDRDEGGDGAERDGDHDIDTSLDGVEQDHETSDLEGQVEGPEDSPEVDVPDTPDAPDTGGDVYDDEGHAD